MYTWVDATWTEDRLDDLTETELLKLEKRLVELLDAGDITTNQANLLRKVKVALSSINMLKSQNKWD